MLWRQTGELFLPYQWLSVEGLFHFNVTVILHSCLSLDCVVRSRTLSSTVAIALRVKLLRVNYAEHRDHSIWKFSKYKHFIIHLWLFHAHNCIQCVSSSSSTGYGELIVRSVTSCSLPTSTFQEVGRWVYTRSTSSGLCMSPLDIYSTG